MPPYVEQSAGPSREDTPVTQVPIRESDDIAITTRTSIINRQMNDLFRTMLEPSRTHTGFRVNLVNIVKFVALYVYVRNSFSRIANRHLW